MSAHSKLGASSMYRWSACPGSVRLSEGIEKVESEYAKEGTLAHELAALMLVAPHSAEILTPQYPPDMVEAVSTYVKTVKEDAGDNKILIEQRFDLSTIFPGCFGTADAVVYDPHSRILRVYDYKHGQGIVVEVENNPQLKYYGLGALLSTGYPCSEVELVIIQPRAYHPDGPVRRWRTSAIDMVEFSADLYDFAEKTQDPGAKLVSGSHCRFCPASGVCPELSAKALAIAQTEFKPAPSYDPEVLSETLKKVDMLEDYAKSVRAFAYAEAQHGRCPPGWKLVPKRPSRHWKPQSTIDALSETFKLKKESLIHPAELKSPAQVEKLLSKEQKKIFGDFTISISSGLALVEESDLRPSALVGAETEFSKIEADHFNQPTN